MSANFLKHKSENGVEGGENLSQKNKYQEKDGNYKALVLNWNNDSNFQALVKRLLKTITKEEAKEECLDATVGIDADTIKESILKNFSIFFRRK